MVLDKRTGLYKVPAHHLQHHQPTARPSFNSMDYEAANGTDEHGAEKSVPKRKFQRKASSSGLASLGPVYNGDMVKAVKASVKSAKEAFRSPQPAASTAAAASAAAASTAADFAATAAAAAANALDVNSAPAPEPASAGRSPTSAATTSSTQEFSEAENVPPADGPSAASIWIATTAEPKQEANIREFVSKYTNVQYCVNFQNELKFLIEHRNYRDAADSLGSLPCLGQRGSGCNPHSEAILRRGLEDAQANNDATLGPVGVDDQQVLHDAAQRNVAAEAFLGHAILARVPVPLGRVEGIWRLFCPQYAAEHMDKYGSGERVLMLQSVPTPLSAADHRSLYKGRLHFPPRARMYSLENFPVPPHASFRTTTVDASFRTTTVQTTVEKHKVDIVFLGNGYLLLRVLMSMMLSDKETCNENGQSMVMEFLGVHQGAAIWEIEDD